MESFLNGRTEQPKAKISVKKPSGLESANMRVPEPGSALDTKGLEEEIHTLAEGEHTPTVQVVMEDDEVKKILVKCSCGQNIELSCKSVGAKRAR